MPKPGLKFAFLRPLFTLVTFKAILLTAQLDIHRLFMHGAYL